MRMARQSLGPCFYVAVMVRQRAIAVSWRRVGEDPPGLPNELIA